MDHYIDIRVLPNADLELGENFLISKVFAKLHCVLPSVTQGRAGVSFPSAGKTPGNTLRIHATAAYLDTLMATDWLSGLIDYVSISAISRVPEHCQYRTVRRVQAKSVHNKRKRSVARGWLTEEEAVERISDDQYRVLNLPFLQIKSLSNGNRMRVYFEQGKLQDTPQTGTFSAYGLSATATIPWF